LLTCQALLRHAAAYDAADYVIRRFDATLLHAAQQSIRSVTGAAYYAVFAAFRQMRAIAAVSLMIFFRAAAITRAYLRVDDYFSPAFAD